MAYQANFIKFTTHNNISSISDSFPITKYKIPTQIAFERSQNTYTIINRTDTIVIIIYIQTDDITL